MNELRNFIPDKLQEETQGLVVLINFIDVFKKGDDDENRQHADKDHGKNDHILSEEITVHNVGEAKGKTRPS